MKTARITCVGIFAILLLVMSSAEATNFSQTSAMGTNQSSVLPAQGVSPPYVSLPSVTSQKGPNFEFWLIVGVAIVALGGSTLALVLRRVRLRPKPSQ